MPAAKKKPKIAEIHEIADLIVETDLNNARIHDEGNIELIERSLADVGLSRSIVIDEAGNVLAGKGTTSAAMRAGYSKIQVVDADGDTLVAVRRTGLSATKKKRLAIFDNKTTDTSMFDFSALGELYQEGVLDGIFPDGELLQLVDPDALAMQMIAEAGGEVVDENLVDPALAGTSSDGPPPIEDLPPIEVPDALWATNNEWDLPLLNIHQQATAIALPALIWGFAPRKMQNLGTWLFYTEDYRYSKLWKAPADLLQTQCKVAVEPNFSCYRQMPKAVALWRIFQKRWLARYWQLNGVKVLVDLNVAPEFYDINLLGVPEGWKAYATRGYNDRISDTHLEFEIATKRAKTKDILFVVYGGGQKVKREAQQQGWVWIPETMDVKSGKEEALS